MLVIDSYAVSDDYSVFRKVYENPILKSRAPDASPKEVELGEARTQQVRLICSTAWEVLSALF